MLTTATIDLEKLLRPVIQDLSFRTQETAAFYIRDGNDRTCLYCVNSPRSARHHLEEGSRLPLGHIEEGVKYPLIGRRGAACSILLSYGPELDASLDLQEIRKQQSAVSDGARDPDLAAVAVPVLNRQDEFLGALSVSGLRTRFTPEQFTIIKDLLRRTTTRLAADMPPLALIDPAQRTKDTTSL
jgi:DNA-binding IclR family transcriptional regulator